MQQRELVKQSPIRSSYLSYSVHYGRVYAVESTLELDYLNLIRFEKTAESVESQPFSIQFQLEGRPRRYTPDFLVRERGVQYVDEVKTRNAANKPEFRRKAEKLTRFFRNRGQTFSCVDRRLHSPRAQSSKSPVFEPGTGFALAD